MTNLSMSLVNILYNCQLLRFAGENGVAAYGVIKMCIRDSSWATPSV